MLHEVGNQVVVGGGVVLARSAGAGALLGHEAFEGGRINLEALFLRHQHGEVEREAVGVVELERLGAGEQLVASGAEFFDYLVEVRNAAVQRGGKGFLLGAQRADDLVAARGQLGEEAAHLFFQHGEQLAQERLGEAEVAAVARGAAQQPAQHVAAALVAGHDAIGDGKGQRAQVVGNHAHGHGVFAFGVGLAGKRGHGLDQRHEHIRVVVGGLALDDRHHALETHAGIHALGRQLVERAVGLAVVLHENVVPDFDHQRRAGVDHVRRAAVGGQVKMDFRAGAAGAGLAHFPEVVLFAEAQDVAGINIGAGAPDVGGFVIGGEHRGPEPVFGQLPDGG